LSSPSSTSVAIGPDTEDISSIGFLVAGTRFDVVLFNVKA
jgi:hypothetical protein